MELGLVFFASMEHVLSLPGPVSSLGADKPPPCCLEQTLYTPLLVFIPFLVCPARASNLISYSFRSFYHVPNRTLGVSRPSEATGLLILHAGCLMSTSTCPRSPGAAANSPAPYGRRSPPCSTLPDLSQGTCRPCAWVTSPFRYNGRPCGQCLSLTRLCLPENKYRHREL